MVNFLEKGYTDLTGRTYPYKKPELPPWMGMQALPYQAMPQTPSEAAMAWLGGLTGPLEFMSKKGAEILSAPFRPAPTEPTWRPPTEEEKARGIFAYQPTGAEERAYEEWQAPGISTEALHLFKLPWTPEETKPWELTVKTPLEELAYLPLWMTGARGAVAPAQAAARGIERRTPQMIKTALKEEVGMARLPRPPVTPEPAQPAVKKLLDILKIEKPVLRETRALRHEELQRRAAMMGKAVAEGEPEAALARAAQLRAGKLPTAGTPLREQFTSEEATQLFGVVRDSPLQIYEKVRAYDAFNKILLTNEPLQRNEIRLLGEVFGPEFVARFDTLGRKAIKLALDLANLPRALIASGELSATLRQGGILLARRPYLAPQMVWKQIKAFFSKKSLQELDDAIRTDKDFTLFNELGGYTAPLPGKTAQLWKAEEAFMSRFTRHIPVVAQSERAYIGGLNYLRFESFKHGKRLFEKMGTTSDEDLRGLIKLITTASGRGNWSILKGDVGPIANAILFSPRLQLSRLQLPTYLFHKSPAVRKEAWRTLIQFMGFGVGILSMAKMAGAEIGFDPRSADFGKIKVGKTRLDIWTGFLQYARFLTQMITAQRKTETGEIVELNRAQVGRRFIQSKLAPAAGFLNDLLEGVTYMGEEMSFETESMRRQAYNRLAPMFWQDMIDAISEEGLMGGLVTSPGLFGVGVITYRPREAPIIGKSPSQQLEEQIWAKYPPYLKQIADQIKLLERTDPLKAKQLQRQHPQILSIRREIALSKIQGQQEITQRQQALEQVRKQREAALAALGG